MTARRCAPSELLRANVSYYKNQRGVDAGGPRKVKILGPKFDSGASRDLWSEFSGVFGGCRVARDPGCYTSKTKKKTQESRRPKRAKASDPAKKPSAMDAAARVLSETREAMTCKELIEAMAKKGQALPCLLGVITV